MRPLLPDAKRWRKEQWTLLAGLLARVVVLLFLGGLWLGIWRRYEAGGLLLQGAWFPSAMLITLFLYLFLIASTVRQWMTNYFLRRYDPGDPESVKSLAHVKRYQLDGTKRLAIRQCQEPGRLVAWHLQQLGYQHRGASQIGSVFEGPARGFLDGLLGRKERIFLIYRPMLNVIMADQILSETARFCASPSVPKCRRNFLYFMTDMDHEVEVLSSAAGIVNYLSGTEKALLLPFFLDLKGARLFYPADLTGLPPLDRWSFYQLRQAVPEGFMRARRPRAAS